VSDDPHYIPPADRAEGEPGERGCLRTEAEEREAEESAPEILEIYRAEVREVEEMVNPPPEQPWPTQVAADLMALGKWPPVPRRTPLKVHFDQACRRGKWVCFGFSEELSRRIPVGSPWREELTYGEYGEMTDRRGRIHSEVLFYRAVPNLGDKGAPARADEGDTSAQKKPRATVGAEMVAWLDNLSPHLRAARTPNALADLYFKDESRRGSKRYACTVFAEPDKYRGRSGV
jgi:hypothetical protein